jgi:hypothetical protein
VLNFRGRLTLASIYEPGKEISDDLLWAWRRFLRGAFNTYLKSFKIFPLETELTNLDILGGEQSSREKSYWFFPKLEGERLVIQTSGPGSREVAGSSVMAHGLDVWNWVNSVHYPILHGFCLLTGNIRFLDSTPFVLARQSQDLARSGLMPWAESAVTEGTEGRLGSLSLKEEPGKLRVFAMVDSLTQWVLYPLHKALFSMIAKIPQDGTFNQTSPVEALLAVMKERGLEQVWSYDLSAATDRLPVVLQEYLLALVTSPTLAYTWRKLLCDRAYKAPAEYMKTFGARGWKANKYLKDSPQIGALHYAVGQPMGAYSSWAMLAFVHHALVQFAAWRVGHRVWFTLYAVLGDDVVIAHREVANEYVRIMTELGVGISFHKSVISNNRSLEFAKRYYHRGVEATPMPLLGIATGWLGVSLVPEVISVVERITGKVLSSFQIAKFIGSGFKAASGADHNPLWTLPRRLRSTLILLLHPGAPRGLPTNWHWLRARSVRGEAVIKAKSVLGFGKFVITWATKERLPALLKKLERTLIKFVPSQSWEAGPQMFARYAEWFKLYITEPLEQDFRVQRMEVEALIRKIQPFYLGSDKEITTLLDLLDEIEEGIAAIPKEMVRHKSQRAETSVPLLPNLVKRWTQFGTHFARTAAQQRRVAKRIIKGTGASPLMRTK